MPYKELITCDVWKFKNNNYNIPTLYYQKKDTLWWQVMGEVYIQQWSVMISNDDKHVCILDPEIELVSMYPSKDISQPFFSVVYWWEASLFQAFYILKSTDMVLKIYIRKIPLVMLFLLF